MKLRIIKEVGLNNPTKYPVKNSFRGNTDVKVTIVKPNGCEEEEYSNNREKLSEENIAPQVTCHCLCTDCVFNKNKYCFAEHIDLDYTTTEDNRVICECKTYKISNEEV